MPLIGRKILKRVLGIFLLFAFLFALLAYFSYRDLKRLFVARMSDEATVLCGQLVKIGELSFSPSGEIILHDIVVSNPDGTRPGHLLRIERISFDPRWSELPGGRFSFRSIHLRSPELSLITGRKGLENVSDALRRILSQKGAVNYQVDEFRIHAGAVSLNGQYLITPGKTDLSLRNLSSREEIKSLIHGSISYQGNSISIEGWAYPNDPARKFSLSLASDNVSFPSLGNALERYRTSLELGEGSLKLTAGGDMVEGVRIGLMILVKGRNFFPLREAADILLQGNAFYHPRDNSLTVTDVSLQAGGVSFLSLTGTISDLGRIASYTAEIRINRMDLSRFNLIRGGEIRGELTSDVLMIKGKIGQTLPEISGSLKLTGGMVKSPALHIENTDADFSFSADTELSVRAQISGRLLRLGEHHAEKSVDATLSLEARGKPEKIAVISELNVPVFELTTGDGKTFFLEGLRFSGEGTLVQEKTFTGRGFITAMNMAYDDYRASPLTCSFGIDYRKNSLTVTDVKAGAGDLKVSADQVAVGWDEIKPAYSMTIRELNSLYPAKELAVNHLDLNLNLLRDRKNLSGAIAFSAGESSFQGVKAAVKKGSLQFNDREFSLTIPNAEVAGGRMVLKARGKTSGDFSPIETELTAENIDLAALTGVSLFKKIPYRAAGAIKKVLFNGTMDSATTLRGKVASEGEGISLVKKENNMTVLKNAGFSGEAACEGRDCVFTASIAAGNVRTEVSGTVKGFAQKERAVTLRAVLAEMKLTDIRNVLWDSFPDSLLYAGLDGSVSVDASVQYSGSGTKVTGRLGITNVFLNGENGEYSLGPVSGSLPLHYDTSQQDSSAVNLPSFEPSEFQNLRKSYSRPAGDGFHKLSVGTVRYGFRLLDSLDIWIKPEGTLLNIGRFSANIFGGKLAGSAMVDLSEGLRYRGGFLLEGVSLSRLCEEIEPIKGYLSGRVDGTGTLKGSGAGMAQLIGKADFWTYSSGDEKTKISREFLQKVGGPSLKSYLGDRNFDKGVLGLYLQNGFMIFRELEISNRNFVGVTDLSVKVAPYNNRIEINHLLWTITEAAQRAGDKQ